MYWNYQSSVGTLTNYMRQVKQAKQTPQERARSIEKSIRLAWSSLESHLFYTYAKRLTIGETNRFHKKCVKEYAEIIKHLSTLY